VARIPREVVDAVRDRTDIVEVVKRHVTLIRRGGNFVGLCPFHQEKTPSFNVIPGKGIYHCFGCQAGGDVFKFLMQLEGLSFVESIKELAGPAGVTIEERELTPSERQDLRKRATLYDVLEAAAKHYESHLWTTPEGQGARDYLAQREMSKETAQNARLGFAPEGWTRLVDTLHRQGFDQQRLREAGLARVSAKKNDRVYDTFRGRLMIPIRDDRGRIIGFGGRLLEGDGPKYINSPETRLYQKSRILYGLHTARQGIQRADRVFVVEGYFDVLALHQAGYTEAVATCGTALTPEHLERLRRMTRDVILVMDADEAGQRAAERSLPLFMRAGIQPWRLELPGAKDPDEFVREAGKEAFDKAVDERESLLEWVVRRKIGSRVDVMSRERVAEDLLPLLTSAPDLLISKVAARLNLREESFRKRLAQAARRATETPDVGSAEGEAPTPPAETWKPHRDVSHLLWLIVHRYDQTVDVLRRSDPTVLEAHEPIRPTVARLVSGEPVAGILPDIADAAVARTVAAVVARDKLYDPEEAAIAMCHILARLGAPRRAARLRILTDEAGRAGQQGDLSRLRAATAEKTALISLERQLEQALSETSVEQCIRLMHPRIAASQGTDPLG
jgi:DNA primase